MTPLSLRLVTVSHLAGRTGACPRRPVCPALTPASPGGTGVMTALARGVRGRRGRSCRAYSSRLRRAPIPRFTIELARALSSSGPEPFHPTLITPVPPAPAVCSPCGVCYVSSVGPSLGLFLSWAESSLRVELCPRPASCLPSGVVKPLGGWGAQQARPQCSRPGGRTNQAGP